MPVVFEVLYDIAVELQTNPKFKHLTRYHDPDRVAVESRLQTIINRLMLPGENLLNNWGKLRIFCRNFVNPDLSFTDDRKVKDFLDQIEASYFSEDDRVRALINEVTSKLKHRRAGELSLALQKLCSPTKLSCLGSRTYLEWLDNRWRYWQPKDIEDVVIEELTADLGLMIFHPEAKIPGLTFVSAVRYFAELGLTTFSPPGHHVTVIMNFLTLSDGEDQAFNDLIRIAQIEKVKINSKKFAWLKDGGGITPRNLERLIQVISTDSFSFDAVPDVSLALQRQRLIKDAFISFDIVSAQYWGVSRSKSNATLLN